MNTVPKLQCDVDYGLEPEMSPDSRAARRLMWGLLHFMQYEGFELFSVEGEGGEGGLMIKDLEEGMNEIFTYSSADLTFKHLYKRTDEEFMMRVIPGNSLDCVISDWLIPSSATKHPFDAAIEKFNTTVWSYA